MANSDFRHKGISAFPIPSLPVLSTYAVVVTHFPSILVNPEFMYGFSLLKRKSAFFFKENVVQRLKHLFP